jgi:hypothetical protein
LRIDQKNALAMSLDPKGNVFPKQLHNMMGARFGQQLRPPDRRAD